MNLLLFTCSLAVSLFACNKESAKTTTPAEPVAAAPAAKPPPPAAVPGEPEAGGPAVTTRISSVRIKASDDKTLAPKPGAKKGAANWIATLHRGERVNVVSVDGDWVKVKLSDDRAGFLKKKSILGGSVEAATILEDRQLDDRPDPVALKGGKKASAGSLLLVYKNKDGFSEANLPDGSDAWVKDGDVERGSNEIGVAQVDELKRAKKDADAAQLIKTAQETYSGAKLLAKLDPSAAPSAAAEGEAPPAEDGEGE
jgi:hypothetical protein